MALSSSEPPRSPRAQHHSQQLLQCPLLVHLVGAVADVGVEVLRGVLLHDVADVGHDEVLLVSLLQVFKEARGTKPAASPRASPGQGPGAAQPSHRLPCSWSRGTAQLEALPGALPLFLQPPLNLYSQGSPLSSGLCFVLPRPFASPKGHLYGLDCSWHLCKVSLRQQGSSGAAKAFWFMSYRRRLSRGANRPERRTSCQARCTLP